MLPVNAAKQQNGLASGNSEENTFLLHGEVRDVLGEPLPGANIRDEVNKVGTIAGIDGQFTLQVSPESELIVSYMGYGTLKVPVGGRKFIEVRLKETTRLLDNVVVTALGIKKRHSELTYDVTQVNGDELTRVKDPNLMAGLAGKIAGLQIAKSASGIGGSVSVLVRGVRSVIGNNQPLYVIDGIPILNTSIEQPSTAIGGIADSGNRDGGDGISNLNPDDIESISVLKGASASALYGSQAANGVVLITTKKGSAGGRKISFSTNLTFDKPFSLPEFQNKYGVSDFIESWGEKRDMQSYDNLGDFFKTGLTSITSLSIASGNKQFQNYFSYANTTGKGIMDKNRLTRHNFNLHETASLFDDRLSLDGNVNLIYQTEENRPVPGGFYMNPLVGLYRYPRGEDISYYREEFEVLDPARNLYSQNWISGTQDFEQNPYWITNRIESSSRRKRVIASLGAELKLTGWLKLQARGSADYSNDKVQQKYYATTAPALCGPNGRYVESTFEDLLFYGDAMLKVDKTFADFSFNAALGGSINTKIVNSLRYDSKTASLYYANVFNIANIIMNGSAYIDQQIDAKRVLQSVFATAQLGYKKTLFLDVTARNDWSSTLAFTPNERKGYFYPSVGLAWVMNNTFTLPDWVKLGKIRAVYSNVGNDIPLFITNPVSHITAGGEIQASDAAPFEDMKPEMTSSLELGTEWSFFSDRLTLVATFYKTNTKNQFFKLPTQSGDQYAYRYVNAGDIQNMGIEFSIGGVPVETGDFRWNTTWNIASNRNKVLKLHDSLSVFLYGPYGFSSSYAMKLKEGGAIGDIYGKAFRRDENGNIMYETEGSKAGLPMVDGEGNTVKVGNAYPRFTMSWNNTFIYKNFTFTFLIDSRIGGEILSQTQADMDMYGVSKATGDARDQGYVILEGHRIDNVEGFYKNVVGGRAGVTEYYMYDATNIRLREITLGYTFPEEWMKKIKVINKVNLSLVARNLFFIYKKAPFDPDLILSTGNDNQGIEVYGMPTTRSVGFNIKCEF
ncbi:MAG: SusC/RagA family TonB-linked outer membrane protein [Bacteroidales bacterium]|nr:SusC/RagA family TonB-linked outer membrane protein [Bacteroidales bacterium]